MLKLISDENFNGVVLRGLLRRYPEIDVVRVQDEGLVETPDPEILAWAGQEWRILLTHDQETIPGYAFDRVRAGLLMPGVFVVDDLCGIGTAIESIAIVVFCSLEGEWTDQVLFLPWK